jgi:small-conductance mechanosensitive channel
MIAAIESFEWVGAVLIPLIPVVAACGMIFSALAFSMYRGSWLKDRLAKRWSARRREVLHLDIQNGFYFFMDRLMILSKRLLWLSTGLGVVVALVYRQALPPIALIVSLGMVLWAVVHWFIAHCRVDRFTDLLDGDGYGSIGRARTDWCSRERDARSFLIGAAAVFLAAAFILLTGR